MNLIVNFNVDLTVNLIVGLIVNLSVDIQYIYYIHKRCFNYVTWFSHNTVFFRNQNARYARTRCTMYLLWFVLRWGVYGTKLRFQFASWQCGWGFWCLWQFSGSPASPLEIVNVQSVDEVLTSKPVGPWNKYEIHSQNTKPSSGKNQVMLHYCEKLMGVVGFAKVQRQVKFASLRTFVKTTTPINSSQ